MRFLRPLLAAAALLGTSAASSEPEVKPYALDSRPLNLFFFADSDVAMFVHKGEKAVYRSTDAGNEWSLVEALPVDTFWKVVRHPFDSEVAIALDLDGPKHYITRDRGESWKTFKSEERPSQANPLSFHAGDPERILFHGTEMCGPFGCIGRSWYTTDGFKRKPKLLHEHRRVCTWAKSEKDFSTGKDDADKDRILCVVEGEEPWKLTDHKLLISDNFFESEPWEPRMANGRTRPGVTSIAAVKGFIVISAKAENTNELSLFTTKDTMEWHRALFHGDHQVEEDAYTVLESTTHSIQVDVMTSRGTRMGSLFTSNSNGTYFTPNIEHTNRNPYGFVDFEKVAGIEGIILVNVVDNYEEVEDYILADRNLQSRISFDAGNSWDSLHVGDKKLHLHSVTEAQKEHRSGKIFSTAAPGIVMGIGNTGDKLDEYNKGDLYVSHDAGRNFVKALKGPYLYEIGDQGSILVAIKNDQTKTVHYSKDFGANWEEVQLPRDLVPYSLQTISGASGMKFLLTGWKRNNSERWLIYHLNFESVYDRKCVPKDFETWYARVDAENKPICIMGQEVSFKRRITDADCAIKEKFKKPAPDFKPCKCTKVDYECDYNFQWDEEKETCTPSKDLSAPGECKKASDTYKGPSGWRLIPGNKCKDDGSLNMDGEVDWPCDEAKKTPEAGSVSAKVNKLSGTLANHQYLERTESSEGDDETSILLTEDNKIQVTHDHGKSWEDYTPDGVAVTGVYQNPYVHNHVYFTTDSDRVYYSHDRLKNKKLHSFEPPFPPPDLRRFVPLQFNPQDPDWLLWTGVTDCSTECQTTAAVSTNLGAEWDTMMTRVSQCQFITVYQKRNASQPWDDEDEKRHAKLIFCMQHRENNPKRLDLYASDDFFVTKRAIKKNAIKFATMSEYVVIAARDEEDAKYLKVFTCIDGKTVAHAKFPPKLDLDHKSDYTVLESSTHAIFLHVTDFEEEAHKFGSILKSNSNGTDYVLSAANTNRGPSGYVDFEKMQGLEGAAIINTVGNSEQVRKNGDDKRLKSKISHNDGAEWTWITPPKVGVDDESLNCRGDDKCSLHLHSFNERFNPGHSHTSATAVGLMLATGNTGEYLTAKGEGDTYITRDGGREWFAIQKGTYLWEYGDQGSIIVIVKWNEPTDTVLYSLDEGRNWTPYTFAKRKFSIFEITTVPSDTSFNFLLWAKKDETTPARELTATINLDFSSVFDRPCELDPDHPGLSADYRLWKPRNPMHEKGCLFGHVSQYIRKKPTAKCYNDRRRELLQLHRIAENCTCTPADFECDYNYERRGDGSCGLVPGFAAPDPKQVCYDDPDAFEYYEVSGYRRNPLTTCKGGTRLDERGPSKPCPNHEEEFQRKRGVSGVGVFFAIVVPFALAGGIGYYVWQHWNGKFGRIRLGEPTSSPGMFDRDSPWVQWPIAALSGLIAVVATIPMLVGMTWRTLSSRFGGGYSGRTYTTRSSFARGRGHYTAVDADEGELLGDESDEDW